jgi:glycosyltransferase involved in cell wall biosynthesis
MAFGFFKLLRWRTDTIHAADLDAFLPAMLVGKIRHVPVVYDIYDLYAETMEFPLLKKRLRKFFSRLDAKLMEAAAAIILPDRSRLRQIGERFESKVVYVYNSPEESPSDKPLNRTAVPHQGFKLFFGGEVTPDRCLHQVIEAVIGMEDVSLQIIGPASEAYSARLHQLAAGHDRVELQLEWQRPERIMEAMRGSDALFAIYDPGVPNNRFASPNKLFEAMMCGKPIIVNAGTSMDQTVQEEDCGIVIETISPESIMKAVLTLKANQDLRARLGSNGRRAYDQKYSWSIMEKRLTELHSRLSK